MFERHQHGERAVLVDINFQSEGSQLSRADSVAELRELAVSAGARILSVVQGRRDRPDSKFFIGQGKAEELLVELRRYGADIVIFNHSLSPAQERNLEKIFSCRVLDRNGLVLDIFAQRARSFEGKLQVELAQLKHLSTRLIRGWTHLERQKGGIGLRGPGETQLETDRRLLSVRIKQINKRLESVHRQRLQSRQARRKAEIPSVVLIGYTNAGKSTLFNRLTDKPVYVANQLFATLDTTLSHLDLPVGRRVIIADTVGFVSDLPHELVEAFRATLLETRDADLLLHVVDASCENYHQQMEAVNVVLAEIEADEVPQLIALNKIDQTHLQAGLATAIDGDADCVNISAATGAGMGDLVDLLQEKLQRERVSGWLHISVARAGLRSVLYSEKAVLDEKIQSDGSFLLHVDILRYRWHQLSKRHNVSAIKLLENPGASCSLGLGGLQSAFVD